MKELKPAASSETVTQSAVRHLASSIFKSLQDEGCQPKDIICVSTQLLDLVKTALQKTDAPQ